MRAEEQCCDAWVVWALPTARHDYAQALMQTIEFLSKVSTPVPANATGVGQVHTLKRRFTMIMRGTTKRSISRAGLFGLVAVAALVLPTLPSLGPTLRGMVDHWPLAPLILEERADRFDAYAASLLAIAASGTVTLELALAGLPQITIYKTGTITAWLARRMIHVSHVNLVNLILNRPVVPEWLQEDCDPDRIATSAVRLIQDESLREGQKAALGEVVTMLRGDGDEPPSQQAANRVLKLLDRRVRAGGSSQAG